MLTRNGNGHIQGKSRAELEEELGLPAGGKQADRPNVGEAALYGVYFDDTKYDYMQHLRPIGGGYNAARGGKDEEDDVEAVWLEAPKGQAAKGKGTTKREGDGGFTLREDAERRAAEDTKGKGKHREDGLDLPASVLPSKEERPFSYAAQLGVEPGLAGLQPDMDPHLRQVLEALDDEAFVDGDADDDFFAGVIDGGEWNEDESQAEEDWRALPPEGDERMWMDGAQRTQTEAGAVGGDGELSLEARVALFKKAQAQAAAMAAADGGESVGVSSDGEEGDALGHLPSLKAPGARARRAASSRAGSVAGSKAGSAFSMSSSAMFRNEGLTTLDARFDKVSSGQSLFAYDLNEAHACSLAFLADRARVRASFRLGF